MNAHRNKVVFGAMVAALVALLTACGSAAAEPTYETNSTPNYYAFATTYGAAVGADTWLINASVTASTVLADKICSQLRAGVTEDELTRRLVGSGSGQFTLTATGAREVVDAAHYDVCAGN